MISIDRFSAPIGLVEAPLPDPDGADAVGKPVGVGIQVHRLLVLARRLVVAVPGEEEAGEILVGRPRRGTHRDELLPRRLGAGEVADALQRPREGRDGLDVAGVPLEDLSDDRQRVRGPARRAEDARGRDLRLGETGVEPDGPLGRRLRLLGLCRLFREREGREVRPAQRRLHERRAARVRDPFQDVGGLAEEGGIVDPFETAERHEVVALGSPALKILAPLRAARAVSEIERRADLRGELVLEAEQFALGPRDLPGVDLDGRRRERERVRKLDLVAVPAGARGQDQIGAGVARHPRGVRLESCGRRQHDRHAGDALQLRPQAHRKAVAELSSVGPPGEIGGREHGEELGGRKGAARTGAENDPRDPRDRREQENAARGDRDDPAARARHGEPHYRREWGPSPRAKDRSAP